MLIFLFGSTNGPSTDAVSPVVIATSFSCLTRPLLETSFECILIHGEIHTNQSCCSGNRRVVCAKFRAYSADIPVFVPSPSQEVGNGEREENPPVLIGARSPDKGDGVERRLYRYILVTTAPNSNQ